MGIEPQPQPKKSSASRGLILIWSISDNVICEINGRIKYHAYWFRWFFLFIGKDSIIFWKLGQVLIMGSGWNWKSCFILIVTWKNIVKIGKPPFNFRQKWDSSLLYFFSTNFKKGRGFQFARIFFIYVFVNILKVLLYNIFFSIGQRLPTPLRSMLLRSTHHLIS